MMGRRPGRQGGDPLKIVVCPPTGAPIAFVSPDADRLSLARHQTNQDSGRNTNNRNGGTEQLVIAKPIINNLGVEGSNRRKPLPKPKSYDLTCRYLSYSELFYD